MKELEFICVDEDNLEVAFKIQQMVFPKYSAYKNYRECVDKTTDNIYWIIKLKGENIGISGLYCYDIDPTSAWLGWFGILKQFRRCGYGSIALRHFEAEAILRGFKHCRLYTDRYENEMAKKFYEANGYICEQYSNDEDPASLQYPIDIYSKSLKNGQHIPWGNRNIDFSTQIKKQGINI